jgi:hypothetical protein
MYSFGITIISKPSVVRIWAKREARKKPINQAHLAIGEWPSAQQRLGTDVFRVHVRPRVARLRPRSQAITWMHCQPGSFNEARPRLYD